MLLSYSYSDNFLDNYIKDKKIVLRKVNETAVNPQSLNDFQAQVLLKLFKPNLLYAQSLTSDSQTKYTSLKPQYIEAFDALDYFFKRFEVMYELSHYTAIKTLEGKSSRQEEKKLNHQFFKIFEKDAVILAALQERFKKNEILLKY